MHGQGQKGDSNTENPSFDLCGLLSLAIVIRGDWLWKAANINYKNNGAVLCWKLPEGAQSFVFVWQCDVFICQYDQNARNAIEPCAPSGPQKNK